MNSTATSDPSLALALLGRELPQRRLRIGFVCRRRFVNRWAFEAVEIIRGAVGLEICCCVIWKDIADVGARGALSAGLFAAYRSLCPVPKMLEPADVSALVEVREASDADARTHLIRLRLDVVVSLDAKLPRGACNGLARHGVWSVVWGDPLNGIREPAFFGELREDDGGVTYAALMAHTEQFTSARILQRIACATVPSVYYTKNAEETTAAMKRILIRRLYDLLIDGPESVMQNSAELWVEGVDATPGALRLGAFLAKRAAVSIAMRRKNRGMQGKWFVACRTDSAKFTCNRERFAPHGFDELPLPDPRHGCADPFPVAWNGRDVVFAEDILPSGRGRLVAYTKDEIGRWQNPPAVVLDTPDHRSYPCVFEHHGEYYLIPESSAARRVELWRAVKFPEDWELDTLYAEGVSLVDTTPVQVDGRWYFFTTAFGPDASAMELFIFHSERLRGPWRAHPMNPVCSDVRAARMAGHFFRRRGRLMRPAQDCSGVYGRAIRLHEVVSLTPTEYVEREVELIEPSWHAKSERTHTLNATGSLEVIDGWQRYRL